jgi:hypothetical protein
MSAASVVVVVVVVYFCFGCKLYLHCIHLCRVSFIACVVLCALFYFSMTFYFV